MCVQNVGQRESHFNIQRLTQKADRFAPRLSRISDGSNEIRGFARSGLRDLFSLRVS